MNALKSVDVAIAEFNALRAEILARITAQTTIASVGLTASGVAVGFAFSERGSVQVAAVVPFFAACIIVVYVFESVRIIFLGYYIREKLWMHFRAFVNPFPPSWESYVIDKEGPRILAVGVGEALIVTIFFLLGIVLTVWIPGLPLALRIASSAALAASIVISLVMLKITQRKTRGTS